MSDIVTVIGEQTVVKGNLRGDEDLTVFGKIEGGVNLTKTLIVEGSGVVVADIEVRDAIVSGVVVGNISASNSVQITEEGRMVGDLSAPRVIIVDGASFKGHVDMGEPGASSAERPTVPPIRPRPAPAPARAERTSVPARRAATPTKAAPNRSRPASEKEPAVPRSKPKAPAKPKGPSTPAKSRSKSRRKPPKPPKMPAGKRKVKRR